MSKLAPIWFLLLWSSGAIFVKIGLQHASPWTFLFLRSLCAAVILFSLVGLKDLVVEIRRLSFERQIPRAVLAAILLQFVYQMSYFLAIFEGVSPGLLAIILAGQPIASSLVAKEGKTLIDHLLLLLGMMGVTLAIFGAREVSHPTFLGVVLGVLSMLSSSVGSVLQKKTGANPKPIALFQYIISTALFFLVQTQVEWKVNWTYEFVLSLFWMTAIVSVISVLLYLSMLNKGSVGSVNSLFFLVPVLTIFFDGVVFGQAISFLSIAGMLAVVLSVWLYRRRNH